MLNARRILMKQTVAHLQAMSLSHAEQLPFTVFDVLAESEEEAETLQFETNKQRYIEAAKRGAY